jgi:hypothetical protein
VDLTINKGLYQFLKLLKKSLFGGYRFSAFAPRQQKPLDELDSSGVNVYLKIYVYILKITKATSSHNSVTGIFHCRLFIVLKIPLFSMSSSHDPVIRMFHCLFIVLKIPLFSMPSSHPHFWLILITIQKVIPAEYSKQKFKIFTSDKQPVKT